MKFKLASFRHVKKQGFTFTELLVVIAIVAFLLAITLPVSYTVMKKTKVKMAKADIAKFENAIQLFYDKKGIYPPDLRTLHIEGFVKFSKNQITSTDIIDPWGQPYLYNSTPENNEGFVDIASSGPDKESGSDWQNDNNLSGDADDSADANSDGFPDVLDNINNWSTKY